MDNGQASGKKVLDKKKSVKFLMSNHLIYSDTMFPKVLSVWKMNCAQVYMDMLGWDHFHPMKSKSEAGESLDHFVKENQWIPRTIITDGAMEEKGRSWRVNHMKWGITQQFTEPYSPWQNHAEQTVLELKKQIKHFTRQLGLPKHLWCYLGEYVAAIC